MSPEDTTGREGSSEYVYTCMKGGVKFKKSSVYKQFDTIVF